jgi:hemolysin activation/secretion protein
MRVGDVDEGNKGIFYRSALTEVAAGVVRELNARGIIGAFVQIDPDDIDETGVDRREGKRGELRLLVWTGIVQTVRTIPSGERIPPQTDPAVAAQDPVLARIRSQSPVQPGDVLHRDRMDAFVFGLNRQPGRRVDIAVAAGDNPEEVVVDYLVTESKPWSVYAQLSNTGTKATNEWRERFGFEHDQLTKHDDILRLDYITSGFSDSNTFNGSYELPLFENSIRARVYGSYSDYTASEVGLVNENFSGTTYAGGIEAAGTIFQRRELFLDAIGGIRWENVKVSSTLSGEGQTTFGLPYFGARLDRTTETASTLAAATMEFQVPGLAGTDAAEADKLGRPNVDDHWEVFRYEVGQSLYLEPLFNPRAFRGEPGAGGGTLAHEVAANIRGQYAFSNRLIPNEEEVAGGMYSVRGYPESAIAGDNAVIGTLEYRFHVPRVFKVSEPGHIGGREVSWLGRDFRWAPQQEFGRTDWDLVLKAFIDGGATRINDPLAGEHNHSIVGAGVGTELLFKRNLSLRLDLGFALKDLTDEGINDTKAGDARLHFSMTFLY